MELNLYQGKITEHIVGQQLLAHYHQLLFWIREKPQSNAEIDFVIPQGLRLIPLEIKSGKTGTLRSLHSFVERTETAVVAIRLYSGQYSEEKLRSTNKPFTLLNVPYYLSGQLPRLVQGIQSAI
jgi:predicted AAA+ superfamily ATPase